MNRPSHDATWLNVAKVIAERSTCARRQVGCVIIDPMFRVISTGYNGPAAGESHCIDTPCPGAGLPSGTGLSLCEAIHAEAGALLQCSNVWAIQTIYSTTPPCLDCTKLLMNTGCKRIVSVGDYPQAEDSSKLWTKSKRREWLQYSDWSLVEHMRMVR